MNSRVKRSLLGSLCVLLVILVTGFVVWPRTPVNLGDPRQMSNSHLYLHWQAGNVIVLVRHAERCDRSSHPCLGPEDGITLIDQSTAISLGHAYRALGMANAEILSSPLTRTLQTSQYMFGKPAQAQPWLSSCGPTLKSDVLAHKQPRHNLILITHSGCISDLEKQLGYEHALASEYSSSLFLAVEPDGQLKVLGIMNSEHWPPTLNNVQQ